MVLDSAVITGKTITFDKVHVGMLIAVVKEAPGIEQEVWRGKVTKITKSPNWVVTIFCTEYFRAGLIRTRFKPKPTQFRNAAVLTAHLIQETQADDEERRRAARKAYAQHRKLLLTQRGQLTEHEQVLQLNAGDPTGIAVHLRMGDDEFRKLSRYVWTRFHPDKFVNSATAEQQLAGQVTLALDQFRQLREKAVHT